MLSMIFWCFAYSINVRGAIFYYRVRFAFFRPDDLGEAVRTGIASRGIREKNTKVAVCVDPIFLLKD